MRTSALPILLLSLAVCISAASLQPLFAPRVRAISAAVFGKGPGKRQVSVPSQTNVPSQCTSSCNPVNNEVSLGCPVTACCTISFETQYYNCLECIGMALNVANYSSAQNELNLLYTTCVDIGFVLPPMALPGQPASGSSGSAGLVTSTGSAAPSASVAALSTTGPGSVPSSGPSSSSTGAAISSTWCDMRAEALLGATVLLAVAELF